MKNPFRNQHFYFMILLDISLISLAYFMAYFLRFEWHLPPGELKFGSSPI